MINKITPNREIQGTYLVKEFEFSSGNIVPIYHVNSLHVLNQMVGYVKYLNRNDGEVYYRGQCKLYDNLKPSLLHNVVMLSRA